MNRKEWNTLHLINKPIYFLGFKPMQWVFIVAFLFMVGWIAWWLAVILAFPLYKIGERVSKATQAGNPNYLLSLVVWISIKKYFIDKEVVFDQL